ncbi:hypothetical protein TNCV_4654021 [Trichonephila clavipes]|nr:hypothetical protein TNCV_4654021 [Trichonephila clavipes]
MYGENIVTFSETFYENDNNTQLRVCKSPDNCLRPRSSNGLDWKFVASTVADWIRFMLPLKILSVEGFNHFKSVNAQILRIVMVWMFGD